MQLIEQCSADAATCPVGIDVDPVKLRLSPRGVVVQEADHLVVLFGDEKLGVPGLDAAVDAFD